MQLKLLRTIMFCSRQALFGFALQTLCFQFLFAGITHSQNLNAIKLDLQVSDLRLEDVLKKIEAETELIFAYGPSVRNYERTFTINQKNSSVQKVLHFLSKEGNVQFQLVNKTITVSVGSTLRKAVQIKPHAPTNEITITGLVTEVETSSPLPGVNVLIKGTKIGTTTDAQGRYEIIAPADGTMVFSFIGFQTLEVPINTQSSIDVSLTSEAKSLQEVVVIGYGTQSKSRVTTAISQVKSEQIKDMPVANFGQSLAGLMPGVSVAQGNGAPGNGPQITIRGIGTLTAGTKPLLVIDGLPISQSIASSIINPNDIETIDVLKDASSTAIYGSRGSNGVILITTKKGEEGKTRFTLDSYYGIQQVAKKIDLMDAYEFVQFAKEGRDNYYVSLNPTQNFASDPNTIRAQRYPSNRRVQIPDLWLPYLNNESGLTNTDWQDEIFTAAPIQSYQLSASGGEKNTKFFISGNYFNQDGIVVNSGFKKYSLRLNFEKKLSDRINFGIHINPAFSRTKNVSEGFGDSPITVAIISHPIFSPFNPDGSLAISTQIKAVSKFDMAQTENPLAMLKLIQDTEEIGNLLGGTFAEAQLIAGLNVKSYLGINYISSRSNFFRPSQLGAYRIAAPTIASGRSSTRRIINWINENTLTYEKDFLNGHSISALAGYSIQKENIELNQVQANNFPNDNVPTVSAGVVTGGTASIEEWALLSNWVRFNYNLKDRYLLTATLRRDGSSRFGENSKWGYFPSASAGWHISHESFYPSDMILDDVKLRASYGITGNNLIPNYGSQSLLRPANAIFNNTLINGLAISTSPNPELSWETTRMGNIGLDIGLWNSRLFLSTEYYKSLTRGLLLNVPVPAHSGYTTSLQNTGKVENKGWEFNLSFKEKVGLLNIQSNINFSANQNKVIELGPGQTQIIKGSNITTIGEPIGAHYGYHVEGVFSNEEQLATLPHLASSKVGSFIYADLSGDGKITDADRESLGDFWPDYIYGFNTSLQWKGIDMSVVLQGVQGVYVRDQISNNLINAEGWGNAAQEVFDGRFQSADNPGNGYAQASAVPTDVLHRTSNLLVEDASYFRIRNITIGYTLPKTIAKRLLLKNLRVYASTQNPITVTGFRSFNPEQTSGDPLEAGTTLGTYPLEKSMILGLNLEF